MITRELIDLGRYKAHLHWHSEHRRRLVAAITKEYTDFLQALDPTTSDEELEKLMKEKAPEYRRRFCEAMLEWQGEAPGEAWYAEDDFPSGAVQRALEVFMKPRLVP